MAQISTAVSDGVVAATAYYVAYHILMSHLVAKVGFLIIAIAATCGTARYGMRSPPSELVRYHDLFTWLSSVMGVAFVAAMYMYLANMPLAGLALTATSLLLLLLWNSLPTDVRRRAPQECRSFRSSPSASCGRTCTEQPARSLTLCPPSS